MGCFSRTLTAETLFVSDDRFAALKTLMKALNIAPREIERMFKLFESIDRDMSGHVSLFEFLMHLDCDQSPFLERAFLLADNDASGELDFVEWVGATYLYCTQSWVGLVRYAFEMFDCDRSGQLENTEVVALVKSIYGGKMDARVAKILATIGAGRNRAQLHFNMS